MEQQTVYRFELWDRATRTKEFATRMGTAETIRRLKGEADLESAKIVDAGCVDSQGFFCEQSLPE
jgi:hypothetical protein